MKCPKCQANWKQYKAGFHPGASVIGVGITIGSTVTTIGNWQSVSFPNTPFPALISSVHFLKVLPTWFVLLKPISKGETETCLLSLGKDHPVHLLSRRSGIIKANDPNRSFLPLGPIGRWS